MALINGGNNIMKTLGQMVGLLISLYVFDQIISVVLPLSYNCGSTYTANTTGQNCYLTSNASITKAIPSNFATALTFMQNLFGVVGIIGTFEIIYRGLKRAGLV